MIYAIKKLLNIIVFSLIFFSLYSSLSYSDIKVIFIKNTVHVLDIYGKRYTLNKSSKIKSGDYLRTRKNPAILFLTDKTKVCLSNNSSLKIENIQLAANQYEINLSFKKGNILLSVPNNSQNKYNVIFSDYKINNFKDEIIISKQNKLEILNFNNKLKLMFKDKKNLKIPPYSYAKISKKENLLEIDDATDASQYTNKFLQGCVNKIQNLKAKKRDWDLQYSCVTQNGRLVCGNRYK